MQINGYAATSPKSELSTHAYADELEDHEVVIQITHCGICHSDIHLIDDDWGMSNFPFIPGHEIAGQVTKVGDDVKHLQVGDRVGVGWQCASCHECDFCQNNDEKNCPQNQPTCVGRNGGFADGIIVDAAFAITIPDALKSEHAAPMMCGGITCYTPIHEHVEEGMKVGVIGIGGLGHFAVLFAAAKGASVIAISTSPDKEDLVKKLGAKRLESLDNAEDNSFDVIINTAPANLEWAKILAKLKARGKLVQVGAAPQPMEVPAFSLIGADKSVIGSHIGNPDIIADMLAFAANNNLEPMIDSYELKDVNTALDKVREGDVHFRAVLKMD